MTPLRCCLMLTVLPLLAGAGLVPPPPSVATAEEAIEIAREFCARPAGAVTGPWAARLENGRWTVWKASPAGLMVQTGIDAASGTAEPCVRKTCAAPADPRTCR
jgi:hypothetical protein